MTDTPTAQAYLVELTARMGALFEANADAIAAAVKAIVATSGKDGLVYIFGTGHSHMLAEEAHYRAGGLALTVPILASATMLHEGAVASTAFERMAGVVRPILDRYPIGASDVLVVISNSGVNAAPLEAASNWQGARGNRCGDYLRKLFDGRRRRADRAWPTLPTSCSTMARPRETPLSPCRTAR